MNPVTTHPLLDSVLWLLRPLVRLLLRQGVGYPALAAALKRVFLEAAQAELAAQGRAATDSALTLLSGVHRRDVRLLTRVEPGRQPSATRAQPLGLAGDLVGRWLTDPRWQDAQGQPRPLPRAGEQGFDQLAAEVSNDVRPRALLDELLRLQLATEAADGTVALTGSGFAPRGDLAMLSAQMAANLHDHAAAAAANLDGGANFLDQAVYVDDIGSASVDQLRRAATSAWKQALRSVLAQARQREQADAAALPAAQRRHRLRFGAYCFHENTAPADVPAPATRGARAKARTTPKE